MSIFKQFIMRMSLLFIVLTRLPSCVHEYLSTFNKKDGKGRGWTIAAMRLLIKAVNYLYPLNSWWDNIIKALFLQLAAVWKQTLLLFILFWFFFFQEHTIFCKLSRWDFFLRVPEHISSWAVPEFEGIVFNVLDLGEDVTLVWCFTIQAIKRTAFFSGSSIRSFTDFSIEHPSAT